MCEGVWYMVVGEGVMRTDSGRGGGVDVVCALTRQPPPSPASGLLAWQSASLLPDTDHTISQRKSTTHCTLPRQPEGQRHTLHTTQAARGPAPHTAHYPGSQRDRRQVS